MMIVCRVILLDQENFQTEIPKSALGQALYDNVKQKLNLEEADYFGLSYRNSANVKFWLNLDKRIDRQVDVKDMVFNWEVKFYPPAPEQLTEDLTRYLIVLQIRQDLLSGKLPASFQTLALLGSYTAQGEIGDFDKELHTTVDYLRPYSFGPKQSEELLVRISDLHKTRKGLTPAESDLYFLENAKKMALYGMELFPVKDSGYKDVNVGVCASGIYVYHGLIRMTSYKWQRILKISYKTSVFFLKVRPAEFEKHQQTLGFRLPSLKLAKRLWKIAVENHQFFRLKQPELTDTSTIRGFGNKRWRLSVRTHHQMVDHGHRKTLSRSGSVMSSGSDNRDTESCGRPLPSQRRMKGSSDPMHSPSRGSRSTEAFINTSHGSDEYAPDQLLDTSRVSIESPESYKKFPGRQNGINGKAQDTRTNGLSHDDIETDIIPSESHPIAMSPHVRTPMVLRERTTPSHEKTYPDQEKNSVHSPSSPRSSDTSKSPYAPLSSPQRQTPKSNDGNIIKNDVPSVAPRKTLFGVGDLPLPCFSLESAGVMPTGAIDDSTKINMAERVEKMIKIGVPPTVRTTTLKFSDSPDPATRSTWSPPTVKTEKRHFIYNPDINGPRIERTTETTVHSTEKQGYVEKRVKHTITIQGDEDISDQLLLDAIHTVTGLDRSLGVDRIEIKTEEEYE